MQVAPGNQVLQQVEQSSAGVCAGVQVDHVIGAAQLKQGLGLCNGDTDFDTELDIQSNTERVKYGVQYREC